MKDKCEFCGDKLGDKPCFNERDEIADRVYYFCAFKNCLYWWYKKYRPHSGVAYHGAHQEKIR